MARAQRHQPLADIAAGGDVHAQVLRAGPGARSPSRSDAARAARGAGMACTSCSRPAGSRYHTTPRVRVSAGPTARSAAWSCRNPIRRPRPASRPATDRHRPRAAPEWRRSDSDRPRAESRVSLDHPRVLAAFGPTWPAARVGAVIGVGTDEQPAAAIVGDDFVEITVVRAAQPARVRRADGAERMVVEVQRCGPRCRAGSRRCASRARHRTAAAPASCASSDCRTRGSGLGDIR